jgi:transcription antitermination factor NusG
MVASNLWKGKPMPQSAGRRRWFIVQSRIQCEDKAAASLRAGGYHVYAPMMRKTIFDRRTRLPVVRRFRLFNRYLFVSLPHDAGPHIGRVRSCQGVADILGLKLDGRASEISRDIVARFMLAQRRGEFDDVAVLSRRRLAKKLKIGARIQVRADHPFGGFHGQVTRIKGKGVVMAGLALFGRLTSVELGVGDYAALRESQAA